jgi:putative ABC transport system permease protein
MDFAMVTSLPRFERPSWFRNRVVTYVRLTPEADAAAVQASLTDLIRARKQSLDDPERDYALFLQPLTGIHLGQGLPPGIALADRRLAQTFGGTGRQAYVVLFGVLAVVVLLVACVNFMNLATARATERAAEVGVRRALGAQRRGLAMQFVAEAVLATGAGLALALALAALALPAFNAVAGKALRLDALWSSAPALAAVAAGVLATGLVAGSYPAVALSRFEPAAVLRGEAVRGVGGRRRRRALVVLQFAVSVALIVATVVTHGQLEHLREAPLGFDAEATVLLDLSRDLMGPSQPALPKQALADVPGAAHVALANGVPGQSYSFTRYRPLSPSGAPTGSPTSLYAAWGDYDYAEALGLEVVAGRSFSRAFPSDSSAMLLNESAARQLFGDADPIGRQVATTGRDARARTVVGVVKDFNYHALRRSVEPMAIFFLEFPQSWPTPETMLLRLEDTTDVPATLAAVKNRWTEALPEAPFAYAFLDDRLDAQYRSEARLARVFGAFAGLALFVACLGLVGLAAYAATRRRREIGLRKAVGASTAQLVALLSTDFLRPVALACALAVPVAYVALERWLASFASRVSVRPAWLLAACAAALALALAATALQAVRAARVDPARTLRSE